MAKDLAKNLGLSSLNKVRVVKQSLIAAKTKLKTTIEEYEGV